MFDAALNTSLAFGHAQGWDLLQKTFFLPLRAMVVTEGAGESFTSDYPVGNRQVIVNQLIAHPLKPKIDVKKNSQKEKEPALLAFVGRFCYEAAECAPPS